MIRFNATRIAIVIAVAVTLPAFIAAPEARAVDLLNAITGGAVNRGERSCCPHAAPAARAAFAASRRESDDVQQDAPVADETPNNLADVDLHGKPYRVGFGEDSQNEIRLIVCMVKDGTDAQSISAHFLQSAATYRKENLCYSFDETLTYGPTSENRKLVAGWMNYTTGEYGYVFINAKGILDGHGFSWANNNGDAHHVATKGWLLTNWLVVKNPSPQTEGASNFFIGIQMGHEENDTNLRLVFRPQHLKSE